MPEPKPGETEAEWMERCVPVRLEEGDDQDQAVAVCLSMWRERSKSMPDEVMIYHGDAVKLLGEGRIGGYLVRFGDPSHTDLEGDFFSRQTDLGLEDGDRLSIYYNHGVDGTLKKRRLTRATAKFDDTGMWLEAQLALRDEYEKSLLEMIKKGKLGWSSGAAGHLVEREAVGKAWHLKTWIIAEGSLTPTPAEPRNSAIPLKSLFPLPAKEPEGEATETGEVLQSEGNQAAESVESNTQEVMETNDMDENEVKTLVQAAVQEVAPQIAQSAAEAAVKAFMEQSAATNTGVPAGRVEVTRDEGDQPFASDGEFLKAVKNAALYPREEDPRLRSRKTIMVDGKATGMSEGVPADGGYLLHPQMNAGILERMYSIGQLLSRITSDPIGPNSNSMLINGMDETSRADSSRWGGILGYWLGEGSTKAATKPKFRQIELKLKKVAAVCYATDEQLEDTVFLSSWLSRVVPDELRFQTEAAIYRGDGLGKPLGIMNSPCLITVTRDTGSRVLAADVLAMWSRRWAGMGDYVWFINQDTFPQLPQITIGNWPAYLPPGGLAGKQYGTMLGAPVLEIEYASSLNTTGDIMLASMSQYQAITKGGIKSDSSIHVQFLTDETAFRFVYRIDGEPLWHSALTPYQGSNTQSPFVVLGSAT